MNINKKLKYILITSLLILSHVKIPVMMADDPVTLHTKFPQKLDLQQAINIALGQNRTLLQSFEDNKIYKLRVKEEVTNFFPYIQVQNQFKYNANVKKLNIPGFPTDARPNTSIENDTSAAVVQPITDLFKTGINYKVARENYQISLLDTDLQEEITINDVASQYFDILKQYKIIELDKENIKKLESYYKVAHDRFDAGDALARDYLKIQVEIENAKHDLLTAKNKLTLLLYQFKDTLGVEMDQPIEIVENFKTEELQNKPIDELEAIALENRPDFKKQIREVTIARLNKNLKLLEYVPDVSFYTAYYHTKGSGLQTPNNLILGFDVTYNLWQWNQKYYNVKEKRSEIRKQELQLEELKNQVFLDIQGQLNTVTEAEDLIKVSKKNVEYSQESLRITTNRFEVGLALVIDLLDDQTNLLDSQVNLVSSELDYQKSLVDLKKTLGLLYNNQ